MFSLLNALPQAGADIKELKDLNFIDAFMGNFLQSLCDGVTSLRKPLLAAVHGFALGGGAKSDCAGPENANTNRM